MQVTVTLDDAQIENLMRQLNPAQLNTALNTIGEGLLGLVRDGFKNGRDPYGDAWKPLAASTLDTIISRNPDKRRHQFGRVPLVRLGFQGGMANSFSKEVQDGTLKIFSPMPYAKYHQGDTNHPSKDKVPQRRMLPTDPSRPLPDAWRAEIIDSLEAHLGLG